MSPPQCQRGLATFERDFVLSSGGSHKRSKVSGTKADEALFTASLFSPRHRVPRSRAWSFCAVRTRAWRSRSPLPTATTTTARLSCVWLLLCSCSNVVCSDSPLQKRVHASMWHGDCCHDNPPLCMCVCVCVPFLNSQRGTSQNCHAIATVAKHYMVQFQELALRGVFDKRVFLGVAACPGVCCPPRPVTTSQWPCSSVQGAVGALAGAPPSR